MLIGLLKCTDLHEDTMAAPDRKRRDLRKTPPAPDPRRRRRALLIVAILCAAGIPLGWSAFRPGGWFRATARPRSVLLITLDTTRADYLGCYGRRPSRTPNLDRLAAEGAVFDRCTSASPLTLPSHSSMMTGLYPYAHGARRNGAGRLAETNTTLAEVLRGAGYRTRATIASFVLNAQFGIGQGFEVYRDVVPAVGGNIFVAERKGNVVCDEALAMLAELKDEPFFVWVHFYDPHLPYESPRHPDPYSLAAYEDEIAFMDLQVGRLLDALRTHGRERDTLVIAAADHGEGLGEHNEESHGYYLYDTTIHTVLIARCPGVIPGGQRIAAQVRTIDIAPTILDLLGAPPLPAAQGQSLAQLFREPGRDAGLSGYAEAFDPQLEFGLSHLRSWSQRDWKYIHAPRPELYHLATDPAEKQDRAELDPARTAALREELRQLIADAPPAPSLTEASAVLSSEDVERLQSLGYLGGGGDVIEPGQVELDIFEPRGGNPRDHAALIRRVTTEFRRLQSERRWPEAEAVLREGLSVMPDSSRLYVQLAATLAQQGRTNDANVAFQNAVALAPDDVDVRRKYGSFLARHGRLREALEQFQRVVRELPDDTAALEDAARCHAELKEFDAAEKLIMTAANIAPRSARIRRTMGFIFERQERLDDALRCYSEAVQIEPNFREAIEDRARVLKQIGG